METPGSPLRNHLLQGVLFLVISVNAHTLRPSSTPTRLQPLGAYENRSAHVAWRECRYAHVPCLHACMPSRAITAAQTARLSPCCVTTVLRYLLQNAIFRYSDGPVRPICIEVSKVV